MFTITLRKLVRKILGSSRKAAPPRPRTRLCLEALEDRTLPSAPQAIVSVASRPAAPQVAAMLSSVDSAMDQWGHLVATIQQDAIGEYQLLSQEIVQAMYSVEQQVGRLFGINLPPQNQPNSGSGRGNSSGAGSGSGATTSHNNHNQPSNNTRPQSGSGFGSGSGASSGNENGHQQGSTYRPLAGGGGGSCGSGSTTVEFGENGYTSVYEEVNCNPTSVQVPIIVGNPDPNCPVSVQYKTVDGTAAAGTDYTYESGTASFDAAGDPVWVTIPILDDGTDESQLSDYFTVQLSSPKNATLGGVSTFTVYIEEQTQQTTDTLRWNPCMGNNASTVQNWYDVTQGFQLEKGAIGPNPSSPIQLDAYPGDTPNSNAPIIWDHSFVVASITMTEYTGQETLAGGNLELLGAAGTALAMDDNTELNVLFSDHNQLYQIDNQATITNMDITGYSDDTLDITAGSTQIGTKANYTENLGVGLMIESGAILYHGSQCPLNLTANNLVITVRGRMQVADGPGGGITSISNNGNTGNYIDVDGGTLRYNGAKGVTDTFEIPVLVENGGTFTVNNFVPALGPPTLVVKDSSNYVFASGSKESVYMTGSNSSVQLSHGATLECDDDYYQAAGTLVSMDVGIATLVDGPKGIGTATIAAGSTLIVNFAGSDGRFTVQGNLKFGGTLSVNVDGYNFFGGAGFSDQLQVFGTLTLDNTTSSLDVTPDGLQQKNDFWLVIETNLAAPNNIVGDFGSWSPIPSATWTYAPNKPRAGEYQVTYNG